MVGDEYGPLLGGQAVEGTGDQIAVQRLLGGIVAGGELRVGDADLHHGAASLATGHAVAGAHEHPADPRVETRGIAQGPDVEPCRHEGVLDGVSRSRLVSEDQTRRALEPPDDRRREDREGGFVTKLRPFDQRFVHQPLHVVGEPLVRHE